MADQIITDEVKYVTATQAINSPRWPFGRDKFYRMIRRGKITPSTPRLREQAQGGAAWWSVARHRARHDVWRERASLHPIARARVARETEAAR